MNKFNSNRRRSAYLSCKRYTLLTGATGLLGSYLMRDLLLKGQRLAVLVRPKGKQQARERIEAILQMWETELQLRLPRPVILVGDVKQTNLGLSEKQTTWVAEFCDEIVHAAAVLTFHGPSRDQEPWATNLDGTKNVVRLANECKIRNLHYVSTAYVCGQRDSVVHESELATGQTFRNDYEQSKYEAECLIQQAEGFESKTIYRPAVIVGDSQTGYTSTYHGLFLYLRLMAMLVPSQEANEDGIIETPIKLPMEGTEPRNLVPIDWVSKAISHLVTTPEAHGRTYHLTPDKCTNAREVIEYCYAYFNSRGVEFCGSESACDLDENDEFARKLFENTDIYSSYETSDPTYDKSNLVQFAGHLACPHIDQEMIFKFLDFGKAQNWGKRRSKPPQVTRWIESHLTEIALAAQKTMSALRISTNERSFHLGLDIYGPGGGQWQLTTIDGKFLVTPGLPDESCPVLKLNDLQINDLLLRDQTESSSDDRQIDWTQPLETVMTPPTG
ncbi:MAG: SDR family oxidoreductase [Planctomycetota bacterium]